MSPLPSDLETAQMGDICEALGEMTPLEYQAALPTLRRRWPGFEPYPSIGYLKGGAPAVLLFDQTDVANAGLATPVFDLTNGKFRSLVSQALVTNAIGAGTALTASGYTALDAQMLANPIVMGGNGPALNNNLVVGPLGPQYGWALPPYVKISASAAGAGNPLRLLVWGIG